MSKILIVDDQTDFSEFLSQELLDDGHKVVNLSNADSAKEHILSSETDLVFLDPHMNGVEGWALIDEMKYEHPDLPIFFLIDHANCWSDPRISRADGYLFKSLSETEPIKTKIAGFIQ